MQAQLSLDVQVLYQWLVQGLLGGYLEGQGGLTLILALTQTLTQTLILAFFSEGQGGITDSQVALVCQANDETLVRTFTSRIILTLGASTFFGLDVTRNDFRRSLNSSS